MDREARIRYALAESKEAARNYRAMKRIAKVNPARPAIGHMPFVGHRTCRRFDRATNRAMEYGFDPNG